MLYCTLDFLKASEVKYCFIALSLNTFEPKRTDFLPVSSNLIGFLVDASQSLKRIVDIKFYLMN
jgi:hypothetical protein